jgi:hypothetical protein
MSSPSSQYASTPDAGGSDQEIRELLIRLAVALGRRRAYTAGHPMVQKSEEQVLEALRTLLESRPTLALGVARKELLVDGAPLEGRLSAINDLAERLHRRGVGSLSFESGVTTDSLRGALDWLTAPPPVDGSFNSAGHPDLPGIVIRGIAYDHFTLADQGTSNQERVKDLWRELASIAMEGEGPGAPDRDGEGRRRGDGHHGSAGGGRGSAPGEERRRGGSGGEGGEGEAGEGPSGAGEGGEARGSPEGGLDLADATPEEVASAIERRVHHEGYAKRMAFVLVSLADQVAHAPAAQRKELGERLRAVLQRLAESSISRIIQSVAGGSARRRFLSQLIDVLPVSAVIEWLEVAARANEQELSHHLLRLLTKLSSLAGDDGANPAPEDALRGAARDLVADWGLSDPNPAEHLGLLDHIALFDGAADGDPDGDMGIQELGTARLVQMALELGEAGDDTLHAADRLVSQGYVVQLFAWLDAVPTTPASIALREHLTSAGSILEVLLQDPPDLAAVGALLPTVEIRSAPALLDVLEGSADRHIRRLVFNHLSTMGPDLGPLLLSRMEGASWYVLRNLLALLREVQPPPGVKTDWSIPRGKMTELMHHEQPKVRQEAFRILITDPVARTAALWTALDDDDEALARVALEAVADRTVPLSPELANRILLFIRRMEGNDPLVTRAIQALGVHPLPLVRDWLVEHVGRRTRILRRLKLHEGRPTVAPALEVLGRLYGDDPAVRPLLELARARGGTPVAPAGAPSTPGVPA